jgi:transposase
LKRDINRECNRIRRTLEYHGLDRKFPSGTWHRSHYKNVKITIDEMELASALKFSFSMMFEELFNLWEIQKKVLKEIQILAKSEPYKKDVDIIKSAPGVGLLSAIRLVLEWGDLSRFHRKEEFASFLGLIPGEYSSGEQEHKGHITKQGNRMVRSWLTECSWKALKYDPVLLEKFNSVASHTGSRKKAIVAVARKLAIRLRSLVILQTPYVIGIVK